MGYSLRSESSRWSKKIVGLLLLPIVIAAVIIYWFAFYHSNNPLPTSIRNQIRYKVVVPTSKTGSLSQLGYQYQSGQKTLTFNTFSYGTNVVFVEQQAPGTLGSGDQIYFQALGLHPYAQFQSKLGPVALINFYQSANLSPAGQTAVLVSQGTMLIARAQKNLTNDQWKDLINTLTIVK